MIKWIWRIVYVVLVVVGLSAVIIKDIGWRGLLKVYATTAGIVVIIFLITWLVYD